MQLCGETALHLLFFTHTHTYWWLIALARLASLKLLPMSHKPLKPVKGDLSERSVAVLWSVGSGDGTWTMIHTLYYPYKNSDLNLHCILCRMIIIMGHYLNYGSTSSHGQMAQGRATQAHTHTHTEFFLCSFHKIVSHFQSSVLFIDIITLTALFSSTEE